MDGSATETVRITQRGDAATLYLSGSVGVAAAETLVEAARVAADSATVEVRLHEAEHLDASAMQILLALRDRLERGGHVLRVTGASDGIRGYAKVAGLEALLAPAEAPARKRKRR
jgi:ABC-type transporter Mla MlaB component